LSGSCCWRGGSPRKRHPGIYKLTILPPGLSVTSMNTRHGLGPRKSLTSLIQLLLRLSSPRILDTYSLIQIGWMLAWGVRELVEKPSLRVSWASTILQTYRHKMGV
jgi:hypothetical protein